MTADPNGAAPTGAASNSPGQVCEAGAALDFLAENASCTEWAASQNSKLVTFSPATDRLCAACGMCCDGVLFHSVVLQAGDSARGLTALGFKLRRKMGQEFFLQPCSAYRDFRCAFYGERPTRCRDFRCRQILRLSTGESTEASALATISEARQLVARVNAIIAQVAETNPNRGLAQRCANALTTSNRTPLHDELESAMRELEALLLAQFRME